MPAAETAARRPFRDNPRLILAGIIMLLAALAGLLVVEDRTSRLAPDFLAEVVLYALSATNLTMLLALVFLLARNVIKSIVEGRRGLPFARFRAKLVLTMLAMTIVPAVLVLLVGSRVVLTAVDRWFNTPVDEILSSANSIAADYYQERQRVVSEQAARIARRLETENLGAADLTRVRGVVSPEVSGARPALVQVYRVVPGAEGGTTVLPVVDVAAPTIPQGWARASADRMASQAASGVEPTPWMLEPITDGGELLRVAQPVRSAGVTVGVVVASEYLAGNLAERSRRMTQAYEDYSQLRVLRQPLAGVYVSFFVMVTLFILVGATWLGLYLAKRITRPVQALSIAARDWRRTLRSPDSLEAADEFGAMVDAFNTMAAEVASSRRRLERASVDLQRKHEEGESRRRYIEAVVERIATGVVSIDRTGRIGTINSAAIRLLELEPNATGLPAVDVFSRADLAPVNELLEQSARARTDALAQEIALVRDGRERHMAAAATRILDAGGGYDGTVLVVDDVTPLIRAQKVAAWREVARRLAHEIKNPLTPIQLSAERMRRKLNDLEPPLWIWFRSARRRSSARWSRSRAWLTSSRSSRACRRRGGADRPDRADQRNARALRRSVHRCLVRTTIRSVGDRCPRRPRTIEARADQSDRQRHRGDGAARAHRDRDGAGSPERVRPHHRRRRRSRDLGGGAREAVPAVLLHEGSRQRPGPGHRAPHRGGAWRFGGRRR